MLAFHIFDSVVGIAFFIFLVLLAFAILALFLRCLIYIGMGIAGILYYGFRFVRFMVLLPFKIVEWFWKRVLKRAARCFQKPAGAMIAAANTK